MSGFLNDELRDWIAVGGAGLAILQTWLAVKALVGTNNSRESVIGAQGAQATRDQLDTYDRTLLPREDEDERLLRDYRSLGVFSLSASLTALAVGVLITCAVVWGYLPLSIKVLNWLFAACSVVFVGGAIFGTYGVWNWSKGRSPSRHLMVASLLRAGVIGLTIITAGALWWCLGENRNLVAAGALWNFILSAFVLLLASAMVFVNPKA